MTDPFSEATSSFVTLEDFVDAQGNGRLLLISPIKVEVRESTLPGSQGKTYESITADAVVLDGPITEKITEVPFKVDGMFLSGAVIVSQLKPKLPNPNNGNKPGLVLGRAGKQPARTKGFGPAWVLNGNGYKVTDRDKDMARAYLATLNPFD